jgi:hypothetical protein
MPVIIVTGSRTYTSQKIGLEATGNAAKVHLPLTFNPL